ncbi:molybdenum cofactor biosynthesis protein MoaE [Aurantimonas marianensis]|uniref:Molybdopterin synthase catalytic subunit n=1 Tax=Aurantimonas marianensis TaxID=2920428 RepID=A0A9X2KFE4_9HYPH|nr:molybdenum cofactor biosynthesis protein MoaE [Aurantimonas marianensis]MCP3056378.1 molybdenum cofactor biosynthesis protein MoaE [Aurantimonas marianensis]
MAAEADRGENSEAPPGLLPVVRIQADRIDIAAEIAAMAGGEAMGAIGGLVSFSGFCRDEGGRLHALELEHYPGMAEREIERIARETIARWPLLSCRAIHRFGVIAPGEEIVFVACASEHRQAAFEAASYLMDFLKTQAPFWKREHLKDGTAGGWVEAKDTDDSAADRWHRL